MSLPSFIESQAQPEPNLAAPAALNLVFISSTLPKAESIADLTSELGPFVFEGFVMACSQHNLPCAARPTKSGVGPKKTCQTNLPEE